MHIKILPSPLGPFLFLPSHEMLKDGGRQCPCLPNTRFVYVMKNGLRNICLSMNNIILMSRQTRLWQFLWPPEFPKLVPKWGSNSLSTVIWLSDISVGSLDRGGGRPSGSIMRPVKPTLSTKCHSLSPKESQCTCSWKWQGLLLNSSSFRIMFIPFPLLSPRLLTWINEDVRCQHKAWHTAVLNV